MQRPWARWAVFAAAVLLAGGTGVLLASRGDDVDPVIATDGPSTTSPAVALPTASTRPAAPSLPVVPPLPSVGVAVETADGVQLVDVDGNVLATLDGYTLDPYWRPQQDVRVVGPDGAMLELDLAESALVPAGRIFPESVDDWPAIPRPPSLDGGPVLGHWRWSVQSPVAPVRLAQWSWECEVPMALFVDEHDVPRSPFGGDWTTAPTSIALGWTDDGRAIIQVDGQPGCGTGGREGVHLVPIDGEPTFLVPGKEAQAWTRVSRTDTPTTIATWPEDVEDQLVLSGDGVGPVAIGAETETAIAQISAILGRPTSDRLVTTTESGFPEAECGTQVRYVSWGGLGLMFNTGGGTLHGLLQWGVGGEQPRVRLASGARIGDSLARLRSLEPAMTAVDGAYPEAGVFTIGSSPRALRLAFTASGQDATLVSMLGGNTHCIGD